MVSGCLLDVNVLLALGWRTHGHHRAAKAWFNGPDNRKWATSSMTECGFIRIGSNPRLTSGGGDIESALTVLRGLRQHRYHEFWRDDYSPVDEPLFAKLQGHNQITDAYLLALCARRKARLVTFDAGLKAMARNLPGDAARVLLIPETLA